ncbi:hypothetical protein ABPG77_001759 [Micractinium sp. CCAP 211/92]
MAASDFSQAARSGDEERVSALLAQNPGLIDEVHSCGNTTLSLAAGAGMNAAVSILLAAGARQDVPTQALPPIIATALLGRESTLGLLLGAGGNANAANAQGTTALHAAATNGHNKCVQRLLAAGAAADARNWEGITPLICAAHNSQTACVQQLLAAGADVSAADNNGNTPLLWAANHNKQPDTVALLLGAGASVAEENSSGETALHYAARKGQMTVLRALVEAPGALPVLQARCYEGLTPRQSGTRQAAQFLERLELRLKAQQARQARQKPQQAEAQATDIAAAAAAEAAAADLLAEEEGEATARAAKQMQLEVHLLMQHLGLAEPAAASQAAAVGLLPPALLSELLCPISCEAMQDPVAAADGVTYERAAITAWIERQLAAGQAPTSPLTGAPLDHASLCPNRIARGLAACLLAAGVHLD